MSTKRNLLTLQQKKSQKTQERIYKTALKMLKEYEFDSLTVRNICEEAGVSTGTFYHYFDSKEDLWSFYLVDGLQNYAENYNTEYDGNIIEYVLRIYELYLNYCVDAGVDFISHYYSATNKQLSRKSEGAANRPVSNWIRIGVEKAKEDKTFPESIDTEDFIDELCTLVKGCIFEWSVDGGELDLVNYTKKLLRTYMLGLFA